MAGRGRGRDTDYGADDVDDYSPKKPAPTNKVGDKARVKQTQPNPNSEVWDYENHWQKQFTDCCENGGDCCCAFFCPMCFLARLYRRTGECCCMFCIPGSLMSLRAKLRTGFRIKGTLCRDCVATTCCSQCAAIQMKMELDRQEL